MTADDKSKSAADAHKVEKDHAKTGRPVSPTEDPTDHSVSASQLAKQLDPKGGSGASVNAAAMDKVEAASREQEDKELAEAQQTLAKRSGGLYWVQDHSVGGAAYVGISPQNDPKATPQSKRVSIVEPLEFHSPRTGTEVRLEDGTAFTIGEGFGMDTSPKDWERVKTPDGQPLFK